MTEVTEEPEHGTVEIKDGEVIYTPDDGYKGPDKFKVKVTDGDGNEEEIIIEIPEEDIPLAGFKLPQTGEGSTLIFNIIGALIMATGVMLLFLRKKET